jgi:predicted DCC family thiol-disulfide oxidoreductase YuxK
MTMLEKTSTTSIRQYHVFRSIFGVYLIWHFACLIPYAGEMFSQDGILGSPSLNPYHGQWPNPFFIWGNPIVIQAALTLGVLASILFTFGKYSRCCALGLWFLHTCLYTANPLTANPSLGYVGLLLLLCALIPRKAKHVPLMIIVTAWSLLALGYSFSGLLKLDSPSWIDGSALQHLMNNPLARPGWSRDIMLWLPAGILKMMTWSTIALEILFVPLALFRRTRPYVWLALLVMHLGIMMTVDFADLSLGMMMIHLFTFQRDWLPARMSRGSQNHILFLDGDCLFCQRSAQTLHNIDSRRVLDFAPLQGTTANMLPAQLRLREDPDNKSLKEPEAAVLIENPGTGQKITYHGASAILRALYLVGGPFSLFWLLQHIPSFVTDTIYRTIARHRFSLPFISQSCPIPSPSIKQHFLP